jgi:LemA protein
MLQRLGPASSSQRQLSSNTWRLIFNGRNMESLSLLLVVVVLLAAVGFSGYNKLLPLSESVKEAWSNVGVVGHKQASLTNQLIGVVKGYQESEKVVMYKVSEDMSNIANLAQMHQQSGVVLSSVQGLAEKFPELKANQQYQRLIDSIQSCESQLEDARVAYNRAVRTYNTLRNSVPLVFCAAELGFKAQPYLEFEGNSQIMNMGAPKSF